MSRVRMSRVRMSRVRMSRVRPQLSSILLLAGLLSGSWLSCLPVHTSPPARIATHNRIPQRVDQEISLSWGQDEAVLLIVDKSCKTLKRYHYGKLIRTYPVVLGRKPGAKLYEGDRRTPTGLYLIIGKRHHSRWSRFMLLDYPSPSDLHRHRIGITRGHVPRRRDSYPGAGGAIGLHGTDKQFFNEVGYNWTLGCISLFNRDIRELHMTVPTGTLVYIRE